MNERSIFDFDEVDDEPRSRVIPWIVIGSIAIVAIIASLIVINVFRGQEVDTTETTPPETTPTSPVETPTKEPNDEESPAETTPPTDPRSDAEIDTSGVVIGDTSTVEVPWDGWQVSLEASKKLAPWTYQLTEANRYLIIDSDLIKQLPASCAHMRTKWGLERTGENTFEPLTPNEVCTENESLYIEILGLIRAIPDTIKPLDD